MDTASVAWFVEVGPGEANATTFTSGFVFSSELATLKESLLGRYGD